MIMKTIAVDEISIRYAVQKPQKGKARGRVLVLPGFTEFIEKHQDQTDGFAAMGLEALSIDWPSQGLSTRLVKSNPFVIHSDGFEQHLDAIQAAMDDAGWMNSDLPLMIFGHSMGGHLGLRLARDFNKEGKVAVKGVMLSAPMIMIPVIMAGLNLKLLNWICRIGFAKTGVPGQQGFVRNKGRFNPMNVLTRDPEGYLLSYRLLEENPALKTRGPSFGWVRSALASCLATTHNQAWMEALDVPVQAHLASNELVVHRTASPKFLGYLKDKDIFTYDNARHELMLELPEVRETIWSRMDQFVDARLEGK